MKLTSREKQLLELLRKLDAPQRAEVIGTVKRQALANTITKRVARIGRLRVVGDQEVERAFGPTPTWKR